MTLAINSIKGHSACSKMHCQLAKEDKILVVDIVAKPFYQLYITNKLERFVYKSRRVVQ